MGVIGDKYVHVVVGGRSEGCSAHLYIGWGSGGNTGGKMSPHIIYKVLSYMPLFFSYQLV